MARTYSLMSYTRKPTGREYANNEDIAASMHLAIRSSVDGDWTALNDNYGILFAAAVPSDELSDNMRSACTAAQVFAGETLPEGRALSNAPQYGAVMPGNDVELKSLRDPFIFRYHHGGFAIAATRTARGGEPDGSERSSFLLVLSQNLTSFTQLGLVHLDTDSGVHGVQVSVHGASPRYVMTWLDDSGRLMSSRTDDLESVVREAQVLPVQAVDEQTAMPTKPVMRYDASVAQLSTSALPDDAIVGNIITISDEEARTLIGRFGRVYNTGVSVPQQRLQACDAEGEDALRTRLNEITQTKAILDYSDGSQARRKVDWDKAQIEHIVQKAAKGTICKGDVVTLSGRVRQATYPVPFAVERADPSVFAWNWNGEPMFMFIATEDEDGNCIDPRGGRTHMPLRVASSIAELSDESGGRSAEIDLLKRGDRNSEGREMTGCFWAPELHVIGGALSILFMPCFDGERVNPDGSPNDRAGKPDMWTGSCHIMQLRKDEDGKDLDPREPKNWSVPDPILDPEGKALNPVQRISLDMTVFEDSGTWYYAWQQVGSVWIASFDPERPTRLTSAPSQLIVPEFAWDNLIAEGPNVTVHDGVIFMIYSGSLVGIDYTTGLVTAPAGKGVDLLDPTNWVKQDYPLQKSGMYNGEWQLGTGHGMWSHDEDGNLIYVFHNAEYNEGRYGGRDAQVRRVHWSAEGMPILDMQAHEELDPAYACTTMNITVV